jgi:acyl-CoA thioesterase I
MSLLGGPGGATARMAIALCAGALLTGAAAGCGTAPALSAAGAAGAESGQPAHQRGQAAGSRIFNPAAGRYEVHTPAPREVAVVIGDSQAAGAAGVSGNATWPLRAVATLGYRPVFRGAGGTGFVSAAASAGNYLTALRQEEWLLPHGEVGLVVVQGGGNDARIGAGNADIRANAGALLAELRKSYPRSPLVLVGTLARAASDGGGRRNEVDALLAGVAAEHGAAFVSAGDWLTTEGLAAELADGVHLTAEGHRLAARVLARELRARGFTRDSGLPVALGSPVG